VKKRGVLVILLLGGKGKRRGNFLAHAPNLALMSGCYSEGQCSICVKYTSLDQVNQYGHFSTKGDNCSIVGTPQALLLICILFVYL
jgi:hypothetical protein